MNFKLYLLPLALLIAMPAEAQTVTHVQLTPSVSYQTIRDFGASDCWTAEYVGRYFEPNEKAKAARWLFSTDTDAQGNPLGIGLSMWRVNLGAGSAGQGSTSNIADETRRTECFLNSDGTTYDWTRSSGQQYFMQEAKRYGVPHFLLFSNSAPIYITRNGLANNKNGYSGANLKWTAYEAFARFLTTCAKHFTEQGYNITMISPVNEPAFEWRDGQEGSPWQNSEISKIARALDKSLTDNGLSTQILLPEASAWDRLYRQCKDYGGRASNQIEAFWNTKNLYTYIGHLSHLAPMVAGHSYWTFADNEALQTHRTKVAEAAGRYGLETAQTEWSMLDKAPSIEAGFPAGYDKASYMDIALYMAKVIHADLTIANCSSWSYWTAMSQEAYAQKNRFYLLRLNAKGDYGNESYGKLTAGGTVTDSKTLWVLGNYSRFVRPGYKRIDMSFDNSGTLSGLMGSAYLSPQADTAVCVFVNYGGMRPQFSFKVDGHEVTSIDTYTTGAEGKLKHASLPTSATVTLNMRPKTVTTVVLGLHNTTGVTHIDATPEKHPTAIYSLAGNKLANNAAALSQLPQGLYIVGGRKLLKRPSNP